MKVTPHDSAVAHVTGDAEYIDDRPFVQGEVYVDVFYSPVSHGKITNLDTSEAMKVDGVIAIYTANDLKHNLWGSIFHDQPFLAEDKVQFVGEPIAIIASESKHN